jgi:hypothetical protein
VGKFQTTKVGEQVSNLGGFAFVLRCFAGGLWFMWLMSFVFGYQAHGFTLPLFLLACGFYFVGWQLDKVDKERNNTAD